MASAINNDMEQERKEIGWDMVEELMDEKYCLIYVDYRESLDDHPEVFAQSLNDKCPDALHELFDEWYSGSESDRVTYEVENLKNKVVKLGYRKWEVEKFFEENEDEIRDEIYGRADNDGVEKLLGNTKPVRVRVELLSNYDCINSHWLESGGGYGYVQSYFGDMVDALWLNPARVKKLLVEKGEKVYGAWPNRKWRDGKEMVTYEDFYQETVNSTCGANLLTFAATLNPSELYEAGFDLSKLTIPKGNYCGIFRSMPGGGRLPEMKLLRGVLIDLTKKQNFSGYRPVVEVHSRKSHKYTIDEVYGVCNDFYGASLQLITNPKIRQTA